MTTEQRQQLISGLLIDGMTSITGGGDSITALSGIWVAAGDGVQDTVAFSKDGKYLQHYASDSLDYVEMGTYEYYISFRQVMINANKLYNCLTKKEVKWEQQYIYKVQMLNLSNTAGINTLTLEQLDNDPKSSTYGQSLGATQYSAVKVSTSSNARTSTGTSSNYRSTGTNKNSTGTSKNSTRTIRIK